MELTQGYIDSHFSYIDGALYYKIKPNKGSMKIGDKAGYINLDNRCIIMINGKGYLASRLIFLLHHGYLPEMVDHKDRNKNNDRIDNLRAACRSQNSRNTFSRKNSTSKYLGVHQSKGGSWIARITSNHIKTHIGSFKSEVEAAQAYNNYAKDIHGEFANLNIIKNTN